MSNTLTGTHTGTFQITSWDESPYSESEDGAKQTHAKITQTYSGVIEGTSELQYLMSYQPDSIALFVGFETITATINGQSGSFVLQHNGKFEAGVASSDFSIVEKSAKGDLANLSGTGSFKSGENGQAAYQFNIED